MAIGRITVTVTFPWWLYAYLNTVAFACHITGMEPNPDRVLYWVKKAMRVRFEADKKPGV